MSTMTRSSLRRSRRASRRESSDYKVGDTVEITRAGVVLQARLAQLLTEGSASPNPRWLIKFDGQPYKDEEVYEHTFGKVVMSAADYHKQQMADGRPGGGGGGMSSGGEGGSPSSTSSQQQQQQQQPGLSEKQQRVTKRSLDGELSKAVSGDGKEDSLLGDSLHHHADESGGGVTVAGSVEASKKSVSFSNESAEENGSSSNQGEGNGEPVGKVEKPPAPAMSAAKKAKISAREQRSRRRQAMIDEAPPGSVAAPGGGGGGGGAAKRSRDRDRERERRNKKRSRTGGGGNGGNNGGVDEENCVKVKFLTGTLYLYRGRHRRAEFVRRI